MKIVIATLLFAVGFMGADQAVAGDAGACYTISDPDARAFCRAKAHKDSSICYAIQRSDLKNSCLAEARN